MARQLPAGGVEDGTQSSSIAEWSESLGGADFRESVRSAFVSPPVVSLDTLGAWPCGDPVLPPIPGFLRVILHHALLRVLVQVQWSLSTTMCLCVMTMVRSQWCGHNDAVYNYQVLVLLVPRRWTPEAVNNLQCHTISPPHPSPHKGEREPPSSHQRWYLT
jgi:hypothetical protein